MTEQSSENAIVTQGLTYRVKEQAILSDVSLTVPKGSVCGLLGPNGSGKTTLLEILAGEKRPSSGTAALLGKPIGDRTLGKRVGYSPETLPKWDYWQKKRIVADAVKYLESEFLLFRERAEKGTSLRLYCFLQAFVRSGMIFNGIAIPKYTALWSRGMQQQLGLAVSLIHDPEVLLLDAPFSTSDPEMQIQLREVLAKQKEAGKTLLLSSNMPNEIENVCDRVAILFGGRVLAQGTIDQLLPRQTQVDIEVEGINEAALAAVRQIAVRLRLERVPIRRFTAWVQNAEAIPELAAALVQNNCRLLSFQPRRETLESLYFRTLQEENEAGILIGGHRCPV